MRGARGAGSLPRARQQPAKCPAAACHVPGGGLQGLAPATGQARQTSSPCTQWRHQRPAHKGKTVHAMGPASLRQSVTRACRNRCRQCGLQLVAVHALQVGRDLSVRKRACLLLLPALGRSGGAAERRPGVSGRGSGTAGSVAPSRPTRPPTLVASIHNRHCALRDPGAPTGTPGRGCHAPQPQTRWQHSARRASHSRRRPPCRCRSTTGASHAGLHD